MSDVKITETDETKVKPVSKKKVSKKKVIKKVIEKTSPAIIDDHVVSDEEALETLNYDIEVKVVLPPTSEVLVSKAGQEWWDTVGAKMKRKGYSQRNIILKASYAAKRPFNQAMIAMTGKDNIETKCKSLFNG